MADGPPTFTVDETHGRALRPANELLLHSPDAAWRSLYAASFREAPFRALEAPVGHPSLIYHLALPATVTRRIDGARPERALIGPRRICLTPGDATTEWEHDGRPEILQVYLRQSIYDRAVGEMYGCAAADAPLAPQFAVTDPLLEQLMLALLATLAQGAGDDGLYIDTMAQMLAVHLARCWSARARPTGERSRLAALRRPRLRRVLDYIEAHLEGDLDLDTLAAEAGISPLHLSRAFKAAVGEPPHRFVVRRRVERAKALLRQTGDPVVEVALAAGFSSQSHLSTWFTRLVGTTPAQYRRAMHSCSPTSGT